MTAPDALGSAGVFLLLVAFALNLLGVLDREARSYYALNAVGAGLAALASYAIDFVPFVVLESTWCIVAVVALARSIASGPTRATG